MDKKLYHYTSVHGFEGIVKNKQIRLTKSEFLNDPNDCHLFIKLIKNYLDKNYEIYDSFFALLKNKDIVHEIYFDYGCNLLDYIEYTQKHIGLYVLSLTKNDDEMNMWNYYGHGGMELKFSVDNLINIMQNQLSYDEDYLTYSKVIYVDDKLDIDQIEVPNFSNFILINNNSKNVFSKNKSLICNSNSTQSNSTLYSTTNLGEFIKIYLNSYVHTLSYLLEHNMINTSDGREKVFAQVFGNIARMNNMYIWKHDLSLYMLVLASLIKSDSYAYENEYRIVYFEHTINPKKRKNEEYCVRCLGDNCFILPYVSFEIEKMAEVVEQVIISPISKNLPIDETVYYETINNFLRSEEFDKSPEVDFSKHSIRW